jgi:hypothetical protein
LAALLKGATFYGSWIDGPRFTLKPLWGAGTFEWGRGFLRISYSWGWGGSARFGLRMPVPYWPRR